MNADTPLEFAAATPQKTTRTMNSSRRAKSGRRKAARIDLGLAVLCAVTGSGVRRSYEEIAAWCDCAPVSVFRMEARALHKIRRKLAKSLTPKEMARCESFFANNPIPAPPLEEQRPARAPLVGSWSVDEKELQA